MGFIYIAASLCVCILMTWLGLYLANRFIRKLDAKIHDAEEDPLARGRREGDARKRDPLTAAQHHNVNGLVAVVHDGVAHLGIGGEHCKYHIQS